MSVQRTGEVIGESVMDLYAVSDQVRALLQQRGRLAYRMLTLQLAESYGWFTEGFDTADLQEAQALLDTLA